MVNARVEDMFESTLARVKRFKFAVQLGRLQQCMWLISVNCLILLILMISVLVHFSLFSFFLNHCSICLCVFCSTVRFVL